MPRKPASDPDAPGARQQRLPFLWEDEDAAASRPGTGMSDAKRDDSAHASDLTSPPSSQPSEAPQPPLPDDADEQEPADIEDRDDRSEPMPESDISDDDDEQDETDWSGEPFPENRVVPDDDDEEDDEDEEQEQADSLLPDSSEADEDVREIIELGQSDQTVAQILLEARAAAGLTVAEVSARTYLSKAAIENIETGQYSRIPTASHCRSYIKKLCGAYDLAAGPILGKFADEYAEIESGHTADGLGGFVTQESESGAMLTPRPPGTAIPTRPHHGINLTGLLMTIIIGIFVILVAGAILTQHMRNRRERIEKLPAELPPVELRDFILPQELRLDELPIPAE